LDFNLCKNIYQIFDFNNNKPNAYGNIINVISKTIQDARKELVNESFAIHPLESNMKIQLLDHLDKSESPVFPKSYPVLLAILSIQGCVDGFYSYVINLVENGEFNDDNSFVTEMLSAISMQLLHVVSLLSVSNVHDLMYDSVVSLVEKYMILLGVVGLEQPRDLMITSICHITLKSKLLYNDQSVLSKKLPEVDNLELSDRNIMLSIALINSMKKIISFIDSQVMYLVFYVLMTIDLTIQGSKKREIQSPSKSPPDLSFEDTFMETFAKQKGIGSDRIIKDYNLESQSLFQKLTETNPKTFQDVLKTISRISQEFLDKGRESFEIIWSLSKLHDLTIRSIPRLFNTPGFPEFEIVNMQFINIAHSILVGPETRSFACICFGKTLCEISTHKCFQQEQVEISVVKCLKTLMALGPESDSNAPFLPEVRKLSIEAVFKMLQSSGQDMKSSWFQILEIIKTLFEKNLKNNYEEDKIEKADVISRVGFQCIQLVCTDFLESLKPEAIGKLIEVITVFGLYSKETNISLSAIGLLWTVYDFIITKRQTLLSCETGNTQENVTAIAMNVTGDSSVNTVDNGQVKDNTLTLTVDPISSGRGISSGDIGNPENTVPNLKVSWKTMDMLWMQLLMSLSELCGDKRSEIRNSANQTLFRTISMNGLGLSLLSWDICITKVLFPLLEKSRGIQGRDSDGSKSPSWKRESDSKTPLKDQDGSLTPASTTKKESDGSRTPALSRTDTNNKHTLLEEKQRMKRKEWDETRCLNLNAVTKAFIDHLHILLNLNEKFMPHWRMFLCYIKDMCRESLAVQKCAVDNLKKLVDLSKGSTGKENTKDLNDIKESTNLYAAVFDTWVEIGEQILESKVDANDSVENQGLDTTSGLQNVQNLDAKKEHPYIVRWSDDTFPVLITGEFSHTVIGTYTQIIFDLYPLLKDSPFQKVASLLKLLTLYHTLPSKTATLTEIRSDFVNDLEKLTKVQENLILFLLLDKIGMVMHLSDVLTMPFVPFSKNGFSYTHETEVVKNTFMAVASKAFTIVEGVVSDEGSLTELLGNLGVENRKKSASVELINALCTTFKYKFDSLPVSTKDPTPLWIIAANILKQLLTRTIIHLQNNKIKSTEISKTINYSLQQFFLPNRYFLSNSKSRNLMDFEKVSIMQKVDLEMFDFVKSVVIPFFNTDPVALETLLGLFIKITSDSLNPLSPILPFGKSELIKFEPLDDTGTNQDFDKSTVDVDVETPSRDLLVKECTATLFLLCSNDRVQTSETALRILLKRSKTVFKKYTSDRPKFKLPMPRYRNIELKSLLEGLFELELKRVEVGGTIGINSVRAFLRGQECGHLYELYGELCDLLGVLGESEEDIRVVVQQCLARLGRVFQE
jgi:hypothetical protein